MHERILNPYRHSMPVSNDMFSLFMDSTFKAVQSSSHAKRTRAVTTWSPTPVRVVPPQLHQTQTAELALPSTAACSISSKNKSKRGTKLAPNKCHAFVGKVPESHFSDTLSPGLVETFVLVDNYSTTSPTISGVSATSTTPPTSAISSLSATSPTGFHTDIIAATNPSSLVVAGENEIEDGFVLLFIE